MDSLGVASALEFTTSADRPEEECRWGSHEERRLAGVGLGESTGVVTTDWAGDGAAS